MIQAKIKPVYRYKLFYIKFYGDVRNLPKPVLVVTQVVLHQ